MLETVKKGYSLEFAFFPSRDKGKVCWGRDSASELVLQEVAALPRKGVIERVPTGQEGSGFYSTIFLTPKKSGGLRPILNLKSLNRHLVAKHFKIGSLGDGKGRPGARAMSSASGSVRCLPAHSSAGQAQTVPVVHA